MFGRKESLHEIVAMYVFCDIWYYMIIKTYFVFSVAKHGLSLGGSHGGVR